MPSPRRPAALFDRSWEWDALVRFLDDQPDRPTLAVVSGRRRQGKSFLLQHLCRAAGGLYFAATQGTEADNLRALAETIARFEQRPAATITSWEQAIDLVLFLGRDRRLPVVLDEFPYLCNATPALPSIIQRALGDAVADGRASAARLVLCGSSLAFMGGLLSSPAPLRGRAGLELTVHSFDYRTAARFWDARDPHLAAQLHAIVGGTPAYRREFVGDDAPSGLDDLDRWVAERVLSPASPLFREGRYLLAEDTELRDTALYHSVLAAIAEGATTRGGIANRIGRKADTLQHPLTVLEDAGFIRREDDALRAARPQWRITEPFLTFHHAVIRPLAASGIDPTGGARLWAASQARYRSAVLGPHFEQLCRHWARTLASPDTLNGEVGRVSAAVVSDPARRSTIELDVVAHSSDGVLVAIGEAKWSERLGPAQLGRLDHARDLLTRRGIDTSRCRLLLFSGGGFDSSLRKGRTRKPSRPDVELIDLTRLYHGS